MMKIACYDKGIARLNLLFVWSVLVLMLTLGIKIGSFFKMWQSEKKTPTISTFFGEFIRCLRVLN